MMRMVRRQEWDLSKLPDAARRQRLLCPPSAEWLLERLINEAAHAAEHGKISLNWQEACQKPGYFRLNARIPVTEYTFDLMFNGRSGYRAQFYLSPEEGLLYNRQIIDCLIAPVRNAYDRKPLPVAFDLIKRSLCTPHAKIWVPEEQGRNPFVEAAENTLNPDRWIRNNSVLGRRCPLSDSLQVDLKGSFVDLKTVDFFVCELKVDRACILHCKGYT
jgi:hypothetical protein